MNRAIADGSGSSPHTRGAPAHRESDRRRVGIIPAYAGSTSPRYVNSVYPADHPRIRGEHFPEPGLDVGQAGSSPHTRGAPLIDGLRQPLPRIIPAYAGSTADLGLLDGWPRDHPRIRGEHRPV